ncbi:MAG: zinc ribbon domain-containing protein [Gammaproteobacteria bacterium]|jgi:putative FmdB family regulatory protein|nr:zinc ribbon domain-containing protein [Gammaproteobacteria bacterium]
MPIYEYQCTKCEHKLEALQKMSEKPLRDCPACGKSGLNKLISAASFRLKGGGWYETDFKTGNKKQLAESESATSGGTNSEKSGNSEKSAEEKPDSSPSKRDGKAPADKGAVKSKGTDSKKTPSKVASS